jgi:predicted nucleic acid-binding protein
VSDVVLDASMFVSAISPKEVHHADARKMYDSYDLDRPFIVPALFRVEVVAALVRRGEPLELIDTVDVLVSGPRFHSVALDPALLDEAARVARKARLRAYDAVYVALALRHKAVLMTLDTEVRVRVADAFPTMRVVDDQSEEVP